MSKVRPPSAMSLIVYSEFRASHSLTGSEVPHVHLWKIALEFKAKLPLKSDRLIDLVQLQGEVAKITDPYAGTYLNDSLAEFSPTSENMAVWIWHEFLKRNPETPLVGVSVCLCDLAGNRTGTARVEGTAEGTA
ncbi:MAG: 6-carboxytetrahydropterin synthase [Bdellovibrionales bacterium]|nr:6-carboxytetrahydropterin synthase [Bdellovibrionales bacterium]